MEAARRMAERLADLAVAHEVAVVADEIVVRIEGTSDRDQILRTIGQTGELRFRPVLGVLPPVMSGLGGPGEEQELTAREDDVAQNEVLLATYDSDGNETLRYRLGPVPGAQGLERATIPVSAPLTGEIVESASAELDGLGRWVVSLHVKTSRVDDFNAATAECYDGGPHCPPQASAIGGVSRGQLAIVLDGRVESAPSINAPRFQADEIQISGGFTEQEANMIAMLLRHGSLGLQLEANQTTSFG